MGIAELRRQYHGRLCKDIIRTIQKKGDYPNFADGDNTLSVLYAWGITQRIGYTESLEIVKGQRAGRSFEVITKDFIQAVFTQLQHIRPGEWEYRASSTNIASFFQYEHLAYIDQVLKKDQILAAAYGGTYIVTPDIVISRAPISDEEINQTEVLSDNDAGYASLTPLRVNNYDTKRRLLHAVVSCKWTIRTDRAQNTRTEVLNLIRNRKGHLPHIVAVTAEPLPARIAALALGTGDLDCVYHFALHELIQTVREANNQESLELLDIMVNGRRLRDISDLPFDLAI
jgi:hypothetical protein